MKRGFYWCGIATLLLGAVNAAPATVRLPKMFSDHMVLQRDLADAVWGWAEPGEKVTVTMAGQTASATADTDGRWQVQLKPLKAGGPYDLVVAGKNTITIKDVLLGDVWICAGQANMEFPMYFADNNGEAVAATNTQIRLLSNNAPESPIPLTDVPTGWVICGPDNVLNYSAVGYFFGKRIHTATGIPIGLIINARGGYPIEPWLNPTGLRPIPELAGLLQEYDSRQAAYDAELTKYLELDGHWLQRARAAQVHGRPIPAPPAPPMPAVASRTLSSIYNSRVAPLTPYGIKGVLWYQGEANGEQGLRAHAMPREWYQGEFSGDEGDSYYYKLRALIGGWRAAWTETFAPGPADFPFYYVQLANFSTATDDPAGGGRYANLRMAQVKGLQIPHTGMAVAIDIGRGFDILPPNKEDVGNRLALWALKNDYGRTDLVASGPLYKGMKIEDHKIRISFDSVGGGLMVGKKAGHEPAQEVTAGKLEKFAIAGEDKKWVWADAVIDGATVIVASPAVPHPVAVRYAFSANPEGCNLYNKEGLPASPFRTDSW